MHTSVPSTTAHTHLMRWNASPTCLHTALGVCAPLSSTPHTCTHTPRHTALHTRLEPPALPGAHKHTHTRTGVRSHSHPDPWGVQQGPPSRCPCVHSVEQPRCPSAPLGGAPARFSGRGHPKPPRGVGRRAVSPHRCQRRCPHSAATASGSGSERTGCECATGGGDGRALGARCHSPGQLPAHPTSAERIN